MEAVTKRISELLMERGHDVELKLDENPQLIVKKGSLTACVALTGRYARLEKLYVKPSCGSGKTVVKCEDLSRVYDCVERLINALGMENALAW